MSGIKPWAVVQSPTDPEMYAVEGVYLVADDLPIEDANMIAAAPMLRDELTEARTTLSILRTQIMVEIGRCPDPSESRWEGVPEKLRERIDAIDTAIAKARGAA